jgi:hypothetical protein
MTMRIGRRALLGLGLVLLVGCDKFPWGMGRRPTPPSVGPNEPPPPQVTDLVAYLNNNAQKSQAVRASRVDMDARQRIMSIPLTGMLACEKPRNFRLKASFQGKPAVDLGSNDNEFWIWNSQDKSSNEKLPYVMHCSYQDLAQKPIAMPIPFHPDMLVAAFGLAEYDPSKNYELKTTPQTLELIETVVTPSGKQARKITVFNRYEAELPKPQVTAHILKDLSGTILCSATVREVVIDPVTKAVLPRKVQLSWPLEHMEVTLNMADIQSAQFEANQKGRLFGRQDLEIYPGFDMARGQPDSRGYTQGGIQRTGGRVQGRDGW